MLHKFEFQSNHYIYDTQSHAIFSTQHENIDLPEQLAKQDNEDIKKTILDRNLNLKNNISSEPFILLNFINSYACNLRCKYCYAYKTKSIAKMIMSPKIAIDAFNYLFQFLQENEINYKNINIRLTGGGEPLMNYNLIESLVNHVNSIFEKKGMQDYNLLYEISTNGVDLDVKNLRFFKKNKFKIKISYDGDNCFHDKLRNNSAEKVCTNIKQAIDFLGAENITVACTISNLFFDFKKSVQNIRNLGVTNIRFNFNLNKEMVLLESQESQMIENIDLLFLYYYECLSLNDFFRIDNILDMLVNILTDEYVSKKCTTCKAGINEIAVTPTGEFFTCPRMCEYDSRFNLGNIVNGIDINRRKMLIDLTSIANKHDCLNCWAIFMCGGLCNYANMELTGDINKVYSTRCVYLKRMIEGCMWLSHVLDRKQLFSLLTEQRY